MEYKIWLRFSEKVKNNAQEIAQHIEKLFLNEDQEDQRILWYLEPHGEYLYVRTQHTFKQEIPYWVTTYQLGESLPDAVEAERYFFRVRVNTVKRIGGVAAATMSLEEKEAYPKRLGEKNGFEVESSTLLGTGFSRAIVHTQNATHWYTEYEGILKVTEAMEFNAAVRNGIGRAKKYGYGMLLLRKLEENL